MKALLGLALITLALGGCGAEERKPGQWPISKTELEKSATPRSPGEATYRRYCVSCHGGDGRGNGGITGADFVAQATLLSQKTDAELAQSVREGKRGERAVMPSHKPVLNDAQIAEVVAYVRQRYLGGSAPSAAADAATSESAANAPPSAR